MFYFLMRGYFADARADKKHNRFLGLICFCFLFFSFLIFFLYFTNILHSLTWDPMGAKISKTLLLLQIAAESCQTFPEFSF